MEPDMEARRLDGFEVSLCVFFPPLFKCRSNRESPCPLRLAVELSHFLIRDPPKKESRDLVLFGRALRFIPLVLLETPMPID